MQAATTYLRRILGQAEEKVRVTEVLAATPLVTPRLMATQIREPTIDLFLAAGLIARRLDAVASRPSISQKA